MPGCRVASFERLEARVVFDAAPLDVSTAITPLGPELRVTGTEGDDFILLARRGRATYIASGTGWSMLWEGSANTIRIDGLGGDDRIAIRANIWTVASLYGGDGRDTLYGGTGNDRLYGGRGVDYMFGGEGDDTIVGVGDDAADRVAGGRGNDSFWLDATSRERLTDLDDAEIADGAAHRIFGFIGGSIVDEENAFPTTTDGQILTNPILASGADDYLNFASHSLFSHSGPQLGDVAQGALDDCYLLAALGALTESDPQIIRQSIASLGDGTFAVRFFDASGEVYVRVDADLPVTESGNLAYAQFGAQESIWAPIFEKAYAFYRLGDGDYHSLAGGFSGEVFEDLGLPATSSFVTATGEDLLNQIASQLAAGQSIVFGTDYSVGNAPVIPGHAYVVTDVLTDDSAQPVALRLHNPWGHDGAGDDGADDGSIVLNATQASDAFWFTVATP